jgi:hypothetical protein
MRNRPKIQAIHRIFHHVKELGTHRANLDVDVGGCVRYSLESSPLQGRQFHPRAHTRIGTSPELPLDHLNRVPVPSTALCPLPGSLAMCLPMWYAQSASMTQRHLSTVSATCGSSGIAAPAPVSKPAGASKASPPPNVQTAQQQQPCLAQPAWPSLNHQVDPPTWPRSLQTRMTHPHINSSTKRRGLAGLHVDTAQIQASLPQPLLPCTLPQSDHVAVGNECQVQHMPEPCNRSRLCRPAACHDCHMRLQPTPMVPPYAYCSICTACTRMWPCAIHRTVDWVKPLQASSPIIQLALVQQRCKTPWPHARQPHVRYSSYVVAYLPCCWLHAKSNILSDSKGGQHFCAVGPPNQLTSGVPDPLPTRQA